jgi:hypothetical protein
MRGAGGIAVIRVVRGCLHFAHILNMSHATQSFDARMIGRRCGLSVLAWCTFENDT